MLLGSEGSGSPEHPDVPYLVEDTEAAPALPAAEDWSNGVHQDVNAVEEATMAGWRAVCLDLEMVRRICRCGCPGSGGSFPESV